MASYKASMNIIYFQPGDPTNQQRHAENTRTEQPEVWLVPLTC